MASQCHERAREPAVRIHQLMKIFISDDHGKYDNVIMALAISHPDLMPKIRATYGFRMDYVRKLFSDMGYRGKELSLRTRMFTEFPDSSPI